MTTLMQLRIILMNLINALITGIVVAGIVLAIICVFLVLLPILLAGWLIFQLCRLADYLDPGTK